MTANCVPHPRFMRRSGNSAYQTNATPRWQPQTPSTRNPRQRANQPPRTPIRSMVTGTSASRAAWFRPISQLTSTSTISRPRMRGSKAGLRSQSGKARGLSCSSPAKRATITLGCRRLRAVSFGPRSKTGSRDHVGPTISLPSAMPIRATAAQVRSTSF